MHVRFVQTHRSTWVDFSTQTKIFSPKQKCYHWNRKWTLPITRAVTCSIIHDWVLTCYPPHLSFVFPFQNHHTHIKFPCWIVHLIHHYVNLTRFLILSQWLDWWQMRDQHIQQLSPTLGGIMYLIDITSKSKFPPVGKALIMRNSLDKILLTSWTHAQSHNTGIACQGPK